MFAGEPENTDRDEMRAASATSASARWTRRRLASLPMRSLHQGGWANPDVFLIEEKGSAPVVWKDFAARPLWVRVLLGRWMTRREARAYRVLEGMPRVPRLLSTPDPVSLVLEYRPGTQLSRSLAGTLPAAFLDELRQAVAGMHERGVFHLDLRHRSNVLAGDDGHPVLIDFASAVILAPGSIALRLLGPLLGWIDARAVRKWEVRIGTSCRAEVAPD